MQLVLFDPRGSFDSPLVIIPVEDHVEDKGRKSPFSALFERQNGMIH
jgi:hypothetical protein